MKSLYKLEDKLFEELDEIAKQPDFNLDTVHKLTDTIKKTQKFVNTFTDTIIIDKEIEKETANIKKLKNNNQDEFV